MSIDPKAPSITEAVDVGAKPIYGGSKPREKLDGMSRQQNLVRQAIGGAIAAAHDIKPHTEVFAQEVVDDNVADDQWLGLEEVKPYWRVLAKAGDPAGAPFVATKLHPPELLRGRVSRPSLVAELRQATSARLVLVSAPAGAGKTTALASWRSHPEERRPFAWLSLDNRDNDPVRFWSYVLAALRTAVPDFGLGVDDGLRSAGADSDGARTSATSQ